MDEDKKANFGWVKYVAVAAGGYLAWSNRSKIMKFLKDQGLTVPEIKQGVSDAVHTGVEKISGMLEGEKRGGKGADLRGGEQRSGDYRSGSSKDLNKDINKDSSKTFHS